MLILSGDSDCFLSFMRFLSACVDEQVAYVTPKCLHDEGLQAKHDIVLSVQKVVRWR